jgi:hypothetical protein
VGVFKIRGSGLAIFNRNIGSLGELGDEYKEFPNHVITWLKTLGIDMSQISRPAGRTNHRCWPFGLVFFSQVLQVIGYLDT